MAYVTSYSTLENEPIYKLNYSLNKPEEEAFLRTLLDKDAYFNAMLEAYPDKEHDVVITGEVKIRVFKKK